MKKTKMQYEVTFSGGKDSLATLIWAKNNLENFNVDFCDTGWESVKTYKHIEEVERDFKLKINRLVNHKFENLVNLFIKKTRA